MAGDVSGLDAAPAAPCRAVLALGSNLGDRLGALQQAVDLLAGQTPGITGVTVSPVYATVPVGGPAQPDYLNAVLVIDTLLSPRALLRRCQAVEAALHRLRRERWGPRTIDVDILTYGGLISADPSLTLPHPRARERAFVLAPWRDVQPDAAVPGHGRVGDLLGAVGCAGVRRTDSCVLRLPR